MLWVRSMPCEGHGWVIGLTTDTEDQPCWATYDYDDKANLLTRLSTGGEVLWSRRVSAAEPTRILSTAELDDGTGAHIARHQG